METKVRWQIVPWYCWQKAGFLPSSPCASRASNDFHILIKGFCLPGPVFHMPIQWHWLLPFAAPTSCDKDGLLGSYLLVTLLAFLVQQETPCLSWENLLLEMFSLTWSWVTPKIQHCWQLGYECSYHTLQERALCPQHFTEAWRAHGMLYCNSVFPTREQGLVSLLCQSPALTWSPV